jgi:hypothetical protein
MSTNVLRISDLPERAKTSILQVDVRNPEQLALLTKEFNLLLDHDARIDLPELGEVSILQVDAHNEAHLAILKKGYNSLLGYEASVHGEELTGDVPAEVIKAINAKILKTKFYMAGEEIAGIANSFDTFVAKRNPKTKRIDFYQGEYLEDFTVDEFLSKLHRKMHGIGLGTAFTRARIIQAAASAIAQVKEVAVDNEPMAGLMEKHRGVISRSSKILELKSGPTPDMTRRFGANVEFLHLPDDRNRKTGNREHDNDNESYPKNFALRWFDGEHEIAGIFTRTISTFTGEPVVRLQLTSNGTLPNDEMLKEVLSPILKAGCAVIKDWGWGLPVGAPIPPFGGPVPKIYIHAHEEPEIEGVLKQMGLGNRLCGSELMAPAVLDHGNIPNQQAIFGHELAGPEKTVEYDPDEDKKPIFGFGSVTANGAAVSCRPSTMRKPDNDDFVV